MHGGRQARSSRPCSMQLTHYDSCVITCALVTGVAQQLDHISGIPFLFHYAMTISINQSNTRKHRCLSRAIKHCACCFCAPCIHTLTYLLTYTNVLCSNEKVLNDKEVYSGFCLTRLLFHGHCRIGRGKNRAPRSKK